MAAASDIGWYPTDPNFRRRFQSAIADGLRHFARYGDLTRVQRLLELIDDKATRHAFAKAIGTQFPVLIGRSGKLARDKVRAEGFDWSVLDTARFWPNRITVSEDRFFLQGQQFSATELIDEVIDALILQRHAIPDDHLERLKNAVDAVAKRRVSRLTKSAPESVRSGE